MADCFFVKEVKIMFQSTPDLINRENISNGECEVEVKPVSIHSRFN